MKETVKENWYVTKPTAVSEIYDICWQSSIGGLLCQIRGGLDPNSIVLITKSAQEANSLAKSLLRERDKQATVITKENYILGYIYEQFTKNDTSKIVSEAIGQEISQEEIRSTLDKMLKLWSNR